MNGLDYAVCWSPCSHPGFGSGARGPGPQRLHEGRRGPAGSHRLSVMPRRRARSRFSPRRQAMKAPRFLQNYFARRRADRHRASSAHFPAAQRLHRVRVSGSLRPGDAAPRRAFFLCSGHRRGHHHLCSRHRAFQVFGWPAITIVSAAPRHRIYGGRGSEA